MSKQRNIEALSRNNFSYFRVCARSSSVRTRLCVRASLCVGGCRCTRSGVSLGAYRLTYTVRHAQAPYFLCLHHIFQHYLINHTIFGKKLLSITRVLWFSLQLLFKTYFILRKKSARCYECTHTSSCKVPVTCRVLTKLEFSRQKKSQISNLIKIRPVGVKLFHVDRDRHDEANTRVSQFCKSA
jgi:hypothetical protein